MIRFATIVEGYGDVDAIPCLISRTGALLGSEYVAPKPIRAGEWKALKIGTKLEAYLELAASRAFDKVLLVLDLDDGCAKEEAEFARKRVHAWIGERTIDVAVSFAVREYETMFLHCVDNVASAVKKDIPNPDAIRGAKEALRPFINRRYKETQDQVAFTKMLDLQSLYVRSRSYRNLCRALSGLSYDTLGALMGIQP